MEQQFPTPIVLISKCLGFANCRYDGQMIDSPLVTQLQKFVDFRPVCPEVEIGLGTPRKPIRIVEVDGQKVLHQPATGKDVTAAMTQFSEAFLSAIREVDGFLLKNRSPSCGPQDVKVYVGFENSARTYRDSGLFAADVLKRFAGLPVEDEGRLRNFTIREHFLTNLFTFARFREVKKRNSMNVLIDFHTTHKLMLMGYNQQQMRVLGKIVANQERLSLGDVAQNYEQHLKLALVKAPKFPSMINVLLHAFGGFSEVLSKNEKQFFLDTLEEYRDERVPLSVPVYMLRTWAIQHQNSYLLQQIFMNPYPRELVEITDSGKGRRL